MRLYNQESCTPTAPVNAGNKKSPLRAWLPSIPDNGSFGRAKSQCTMSEHAENMLDSANKFFLGEHAALESRARQQQHKAIPNVTKSVTSTTASTGGSSHIAKEFLYPSITQCETEGSSASRIDSGRDLPARFSFEPFHFDIEVVKSAECAAQKSLQKGEDLSSRASSSTISSYPSSSNRPRTLQMKGHTKPTNISGNSEYSISNGIDGWKMPLFPEWSAASGFSKEDAERLSRAKPESVDVSWVDFGASSNAFRAFESSCFPAQEKRARELMRQKSAKVPSPLRSAKRIGMPMRERALKTSSADTGLLATPENKARNGILSLSRHAHTIGNGTVPAPRSVAPSISAEPPVQKSASAAPGEDKRANISPAMPAKLSRNNDLLKKMLQKRNGAASSAYTAGNRPPHQPQSNGSQKKDIQSKMLESRVDVAPSASVESSPSAQPQSSASQKKDILNKMLQSRVGASSSAPKYDTCPLPPVQPSTSDSRDILSKMLQSRNEAASPAPKSSSRPLPLPSSASQHKDNLSTMLQRRSILSSIAEKQATATKDSPNALLSEILQKRSATKEDQAPTDEPEHTVLTDEDFDKRLNKNPDFAKYARMRKVGLPLDAVKNAMERDGIALAKPHKKKQEPAKDPIQRFRIHWQTHNNVRSNTMWAMIGREDHWLKDVSIDKEEMATLFEKERDQVPTNRSTSGALEGGSAVRIIDPKKARNCGIILARIKLSYREIANAIHNMDSTALTLEQINGITQYLPTKEEAAALQSHMDTTKSTHPFKVECEKFMAEMLRVRNVEKKLEAMFFMKRMPISIDEIKSDARTLQRACEEVMNSSSLRHILGLILHIGNAVNTAGTTGKDPGSAIRLSSLLKLNQAKAFDRKTTFLEYVAIILRRNCPSHLDQYRQDLSSISRAEKIQWTDSLKEMESIDDKLAEIRRMALRMALSSSEEELSEDSVDDDLLAELSAEEEVRLLQLTPLGRFTFEACLRMSSVYAEIDASKTVFDQIVHYFGEFDDTVDENGNSNPQPILCHLAQFCNDLDVAVERAIASEKEKARELRKRLPKKEEPTLCKSRSVLKPRAKAKTGGSMKGLLADLRARGNDKASKAAEC